MADAPLPSLSSAGWIYSISEKTDNAMAHFFQAEYSQTALYEGNVASLPWIIQKYSGNMIDVGTNCQRILKDYLSRYFTTVDVQARTKQDDDNPNKTALLIYATVTDSSGTEYNVQHVVNLENSKIITWINMNNSGTVNDVSGASS